MALGDLFPEKFRAAFAERNLAVGTVLRTFVPETNPPKVKYFVVLGTTRDKVVFGIVLINSRVNPYIFRDPLVRSWHILLKAADYDFLDHDSYVDCTQIFEKDSRLLHGSVRDMPEIVVGNLSRIDLSAIMSAIKAATTIAANDKRRFGWL
jgi:hypothetical protein